MGHVGRQMAAEMAVVTARDRSELGSGIETTLCSRGQKPLTTSRFIWKVNTHFTMLAPQLVPSVLTSSGSTILQFPIEAVRPVRSLRHMTTQLLQEAAQVIPNQQRSEEHTSELQSL